jgi:protein TonB
MSAVAASNYHSYDLPWTVSASERKRFRRIIRLVGLFFLIFAIILPYLPVPKEERETVEAVPPRLAKLILERKNEPQKVEAPTVRLPKKKIESRKKQQQKAKRVERARKKAAKSGLLAFSDELVDLRHDPVLASVESKRTLTTGAGKRKDTVARAAVTAGKGSGGINTARLSRDTGGVGLSHRRTTRVESSVGGSRDRGRSGGGRSVGRSAEEIQLVFDRNKAAIYSLYHRALREDPDLEGKVVLKLKIAPSGRVLAVSIVSSELSAKRLEAKLLARIKLFNFGAKDVDTVVVTYPIDFLPS